MKRYRKFVARYRTPIAVLLIVIGSAFISIIVGIVQEYFNP